jgi:hypothetical protein
MWRRGQGEISAVRKDGIIHQICAREGMTRSFEQLVSEILWMKGYWVRTSVKVDLKKEKKREGGRPSSPRWEPEILAYSGRVNLLRVIDAKAIQSTRARAARGRIICERTLTDPESDSSSMRIVDPKQRLDPEGRPFLCKVT